eukprot:1414719-Amphidinium_carterae.1
MDDAGVVDVENLQVVCFGRICVHHNGFCEWVESLLCDLPPLFLPDWTWAWRPLFGLPTFHAMHYQGPRTTAFDKTNVLNPSLGFEFVPDG